MNGGANPRIRDRGEAGPVDILVGQVWYGPRKELSFHLVVAFDKDWVCVQTCDANGANARGPVKRRSRDGFGNYKGLRLVGTRGAVAA